MALNGVSAGLIIGFLGGRVGIDLLLRDGEKGHFAAVHKALGAQAVRHADTGVHLVGGTGQGAEHPLCVLHTVGLAENFSAHVHDGVTAQHHSAGMVFCHSKALSPRQLFHQPGRGVRRDSALVEITHADGEIRRI